MACSVLGLRIAGDLTLDNPLCVAKTCPDFYTLLGDLRSAWAAGR